MRVFRFLCLSLLIVVQARGQVLDSLLVPGTSLDIDIYGNLYVLDSGSNLLTVYRAGDKRITGQVGGQGWGNEQFDSPHAVSARNGLDIFVADYGNHRIQRFDRALTYVSTLYTRDDENPALRFGYPTDMVLTRLGDLFICDSENTRILKLTRSTSVDKAFGGIGGGKGRLLAPRRIESGPGDFLYVLDRNRVVVFDTFGNFIRELGAGIVVEPKEIYADPDRVLVLDGDRLYRFDDREMMREPVLISDLTGGRFQGDDVLSIVCSGRNLLMLTEAGVFYALLPPPGERLNQRGP